MRLGIAGGSFEAGLGVDHLRSSHMDVNLGNTSRRRVNVICEASSSEVPSGKPRPSHIPPRRVRRRKLVGESSPAGRLGTAKHCAELPAVSRPSRGAGRSAQRPGHPRRALALVHGRVGPWSSVRDRGREHVALCCVEALRVTDEVDPSVVSNCGVYCATRTAPMLRHPLDSGRGCQWRPRDAPSRRARARRHRKHALRQPQDER